MKQPHTEQTIVHTDDEQNTGNHKEPTAPDTHGADRFGGTRKGAENVEQTPDAPHNGRTGAIEPATDLDGGSELDEADDSTERVATLQERHPEKDENGRL